MFIYLLIAAELVFLYTVFWYLFLREPKEARRIVGNTWGQYANLSVTTNGVEVQSACAFCVSIPSDFGLCQITSQAHPEVVKPYMLPIPNEMTLDLRSNHYVPTINAKPASPFAVLMQKIDDKLSSFNVRP